jgi:glycosyltransferase involved in cell wall biosynthesis
MACGTPVIAAERPAMDEVLRGAAHFVPVRDPRAIADAVECLFEQSNVREELSRRGQEHAAKFSWERTAAETVEVYREVARR